MLIDSDNKLRAVITNLQRASQSETPWVERLKPYLEDAEEDISMFIAPMSFILKNPDYEALAVKFVAFSAWADAIPALDLVATPSGFGVVSTNTVAPASKDRVQRAQRSARLKADKAAFKLLDLLRNDYVWLTYRQYLRYNNLFPDPRDLVKELHTNDKDDTINSRFHTYHDYIHQVNLYEEKLAVDVFGFEAMKNIRVAAFQNSCDEKVSRKVMYIVQWARNFILNRICGKEFDLNVPRLFRQMDKFNDDDEGIIESWKKSDIYKAFKSQDYENKKDSPAYFL